MGSGFLAQNFKILIFLAIALRFAAMILLVIILFYLCNVTIWAV